jgi:hypothetical protein
MPTQPSTIKEMIATRNLSPRFIAIQIGVSPDYLVKVLNGTLPASATVLSRTYRIVSRMSPQRRLDDLSRLIDAAIHCYDLRRGFHRSLICQRRYFATATEGSRE